MPAFPGPDRLRCYRASQRHVFWSDSKALVLVFPDDGGVNVEQPGSELAAGLRKQSLGFLGGVVVGAIVIAGALALAVVPMRDGVDGGVFRPPRFEGRLQFIGEFVKRNEHFVAVLANEARVADIAGEQRQERRAAAGRFRIGGGRRGQALEPDLPVMGGLRAEAIRAQQRMSKT